MLRRLFKFIVFIMAIIGAVYCMGCDEYKVQKVVNKVEQKMTNAVLTQREQDDITLQKISDGINETVDAIANHEAKRRTIEVSQKTAQQRADTAKQFMEREKLVLDHAVVANDEAAAKDGYIRYTRYQKQFESSQALSDTLTARLKLLAEAIEDLKNKVTDDRSWLIEAKLRIETVSTMEDCGAANLDGLFSEGRSRLESLNKLRIETEERITAREARVDVVTELNGKDSPPPVDYIAAAKQIVGRE